MLPSWIDSLTHPRLRAESCGFPSASGGTFFCKSPVQILGSCHYCCCNGEWEIQVVDHWAGRNRQKDSEMHCFPWISTFNLKMHSVFGLQIEWEMQSPAPWSEDVAEHWQGCCSLWGADRNESHLCLLLHTPVHTDQTLQLLQGAPDILLYVRSCASSFTCLLVYSSLLRPDVCSLLSAHQQTEASRVLVGCHQTPACFGCGVLPQTMTSVASRHLRSS